MSFYDSTLVLSSAQAITTTAASTVIYDVTGAGSGNAPSMTFGNGDIGFDIAGGVNSSVRPALNILVTVNGTGAGTITFELQAAPDNGSNAPGTYKTLSASAAVVGTDLDAGDAYVLPIPPYNAIKSAMGVPRFYRVTYTVSGSATATVTAYIGVGVPTGYEITQYGNNFVSA